MVRLAAVLALVAGSLLIRSASAATLFFQAVPTATPSCPDPCREIRVFYEDSSRRLPVQALRFDVAISGASVAVLPVAPAINPNASGGNGFERTTLAVRPWNLGSVVGESSAPDHDVRIVNEADKPLSVDAVAASLVEGCAGASCAAITAGLGANRLYLGRFNVTWNGDAVAIRVGMITGEGAGAVDPLEGIARLGNVEFNVEGLPHAVETRPGALPRRRRLAPPLRPDRDPEPRSLPSHARALDRTHALPTVERPEKGAPSYGPYIEPVAESARTTNAVMDQQTLHPADGGASTAQEFCAPAGSGCTTTEYEFSLKPVDLVDEFPLLPSMDTTCGLHGHPGPLPGRMLLREQTRCRPTSEGPLCTPGTVPVGTSCHLPTSNDDCTAAGVPFSCCTGRRSGDCVQPSAPNEIECGFGGVCALGPGASCRVELRLSNGGAPLVADISEISRALDGIDSLCSDASVRCQAMIGWRYVLPSSRGGDGARTYVRWVGGAGTPFDADWQFAAGQGSVFYTGEIFGRPASCSRYPPSESGPTGP